MKARSLVPPLLEHEWAALVNRANGRKILFRIAAAAVACVLLFLWMEAALQYQPAGGLIFKGLFVPAALLLAFSARGLGAALAEHRRNDMLGLLFLTGCKPRHLFLAQIGARVAAAGYVAFAILPCLAISILYGGATKERCVAAALFAVVEVLFLISLEFVGPAVTDDAGTAGLISNISVGILAFWPWIIDRISGVLAGTPLPYWIYFFSPVSAFLQVLSGFTNRAQFYDFLVTVALVTAQATIALFGSAWILSQTWREEDHPLLRFRIVRWMMNQARRSHRQWAKILRPRLESEPLLWIAAYDQRSVRFAWATVLVILALWFAGLAAWRIDWVVPAICYLAAAALIYGVRLQMLLRVAARFAESRQNQYFDAILASNQLPEKIVEAEEAAVYLQFGAVIWIVRALTLFFVVTATFLRKWTPLTFAEHAVLSIVLLWASELRPRTAIARMMWIALNTGSGVATVFRRSSIPLANFGFQFYRIISAGAAHLGHFPTGGDTERFVVLIGGPAVMILLSIDKFERRKLQTRIANHFRAILQAPVPSSKVIAKWDMNEPLIG